MGSKKMLKIRLEFEGDIEIQVLSPDEASVEKTLTIICGTVELESLFRLLLIENKDIDDLISQLRVFHDIINSDVPF